ncbi:hypothetical protein E6W39_37065 [Kitasatospora acidiphila]|uniref:Uncharacterized protein n=1 Tax=Kitasatospora acidiphila TaxID=2567942 RepID=A0A540WCM5_9ACTN|nr:hypothetical protein [Kitasatospora acidiphila]TQF06780.1 hypothetical protein E6W39_37065 [Kitasatospora acidiphila]
MSAMEQQSKSENKSENKSEKGAPKPHPFRDMWDAVWNIRLTWVLIMIGVSMGLGLCAYQIATEQVVEIMAVFWGLTVLAILIFTARWLTERPGSGRHRQVAH